MSDTVAELLRVSTPTLEEYAERSGIGYSTLRDWKRQPRAPRSGNIARLIQAAESQRDDLDRILRELRRASRG